MGSGIRVQIPQRKRLPYQGILGTFLLHLLIILPTLVQKALGLPRDEAKGPWPFINF